MAVILRVVTVCFCNGRCFVSIRIIWSMVSSLKTVVTHPGISDAGQCLTTALISDCG